MNKPIIICGDNLTYLLSREDNSFDSCITDPPYGMGMEHWDYSVPPKETWEGIFRVLKPGAFCLSFCSPEFYHRLACNIEDAGFKIKDMILWMITTKMPKNNRLKPAHEPIVVAQKPFKGSIDSNMEIHGVGKINLDTTRIEWGDQKPPKGWVANGYKRRFFGKGGDTSGSQEVDGKVDADERGRYPSNIIGNVEPDHQKYFYAPRVSSKEREEYNDHPTPKPIDLMRYLIRVYAPKGSLILDPFSGSGSTGIAAFHEKCDFIGIEKEKEYCEISERRIADIEKYTNKYSKKKPIKSPKKKKTQKRFKELVLVR